MHAKSQDEQVRAAHRYFSSFVDDYHRAFEGQGESALHRTINVLFRRKTFARRMAVVGRFLEQHGVAGKRLLDLGCGSGEVSLLAARLGARVTGLDVVEGMVATARDQARQASLDERAEFHVADVTAVALPPSDVTLVVSVCEYYADVDAFLTKVCRATEEMLVIVDTRGPWWRRMLRHTLAWFKRFDIYYRTPEEFAAIVSRAGFLETERVRGHSFWALAFARAKKSAR
jgi:2-polyprenyl-3-methyl-5-hydroxy-6-metoxy-1,4-benzoquinol methylase